MAAYAPVDLGDMLEAAVSGEVQLTVRSAFEPPAAQRRAAAAGGAADGGWWWGFVVPAWAEGWQPAAAVLGAAAFRPCEYGGHPRQLVVAEPWHLRRLDLRVPAPSVPSASGGAYCPLLWTSQERIYSLATHPSDGFGVVVATEKSVVVLDARYTRRPLLRYSLPSSFRVAPPQVLAVLRHHARLPPGEAGAADASYYGAFMDAAPDFAPPPIHPTAAARKRPLFDADDARPLRRRGAVFSLEKHE